jgi:23S rRNA (uracil1939-C5)-methyltransferase
MKPIPKLDKDKARALISIHSLSHDGRGIGVFNNKTTFVSGALPGETITCHITQKRSTFNEAEVMEIIEGSPERTTPPCSHFGVCGGCSLQHMSHHAQIELKQNTLLDQLKHFGKVTPESILPPLSAETSGYRRKARLGVKYVIKKNKLLIGFREKSSRYLADLESCIVLHPEVGKRFSELSELITSLAIYQAIPQIEVAIGDHDVALVIRHLESLSETDAEKLAAFAKQYQFQIYSQPNPPLPIQKIWPRDDNHRLSYTLPEYQLEFRFHPLDFTQINLEMNRLMVKQAIHLLDLTAEDKVIDLFCGIGNFTLPIAKHVSHVTGVEGGDEMVTRANDNAAHNKISNVEFHAANLMEPPTQAAWINAQYDKVLLDPPRAGAKEILPFIANSGAKKIVYVSCNPATLARDAGELVHQYGYQLKQAGVMNMFPHTAHIEAMAVFEKS